MGIRFQKIGSKEQFCRFKTWLGVLEVIVKPSPSPSFWMESLAMAKLHHKKCPFIVESWDYDTPMLCWEDSKGHLTSAGIEGVTFKSLGINPKERLASLLCHNKDFLREQGLLYLKFNEKDVLELGEPRHSLLSGDFKLYERMERKIREKKWN